MLMQFLLIKLISFYQKTISPDHGFMSYLYPYGYCRFYPSCSEHCRRMIIKHGALKGVAMGLWRVVRCNPFTKND